MKSIINQGRGSGKTLVGMMMMFDMFDTYTLEKQKTCWKFEGQIRECYVLESAPNLMDIFNLVGKRLTALPKAVWANERKE